MKAEEITMGVSLISEKVYAGKANKSGDSWLDKKDVTSDFLKCVIEYFYGYEPVEIVGEDGNKFKVTVEEVKENETEANR